ncbi:hypothetical protein EIP91_004488 [Steccherinum ochraceum]|uniref:SHSP domain-containing protein n=1 Tax=Steccherinum ochraceum TaxID=92696 RepID=A0A4R0RH75_9APHY|nr:hypothetical protein EIP91_004488 [Steccherinum ochraceum]
MNIEIHNDMLTVSEETKISSEHDENGYTVGERCYGKFLRPAPLSRGVKSKDIKVSLEDEVLSVRFPKTSAAQATIIIVIN